MQGTAHIRRRDLAPLLAASLLLLGPSAFAQTNRVAEIATYEGADREQRLVEGAKREKEVTFYSSMPPEDIALLAAAFDKKYGIKVKVWRADSESLPQRIINDAKARRYEVDIVLGASSALEPLQREPGFPGRPFRRMGEILHDDGDSSGEFRQKVRPVDVNEFRGGDKQKAPLPRPLPEAERGELRCSRLPVSERGGGG